MKNSSFFSCILVLCLSDAQAGQLIGTVQDSLPVVIQDTLPAISKIKVLRQHEHPTPFVEPAKPSAPIIVTAIPFHGSFSAEDTYTDMEVSSESSLFRFRSNFLNMTRPLVTYDSSEVYFLSPDINRSNASRYQYRLLLNGGIIIQPWQDILNFADTLFGAINFKKGIAFLGAYKTTWNNWLRLELKVKEADSILSMAIVSWKPIKPVLLDIYPAGDLDVFFDRLERSGSVSKKKDPVDTGLNRWKKIDEPGELGSATVLPTALLLKAGQGNLIFNLQGRLLKKEDLEYQLIKDGDVYYKWKPNDFNNNFISLKNLPPGRYELQMRFRLQRHNTTSYPFYIQREWFQTALFKIGVTAVVILFLVLLFSLWKQKQKTTAEKIKTLAEKAKKEKFQLDLRAIRSQLNPHFVSNALVSIQRLMNINEQKSANHYFVEFSRLLRQSLENEDSDYVPLEQELIILERYIKLEQLRFGFRYSISVDKGVANLEIPPLLIQPLIENAVKHGAGPKYGKGWLEVKFLARGKNMLIDIIDNGNGFPDLVLNYGFGLRLVTDRIKLLNANLDGAQIHISFSQIKNTSTTVHLTFENWI